jgi:RNA-binding protein Musashi
LACHNILVVSTLQISIQDPKRSGHRGFGFVTFADEGVAERVSRRSHEILGHEVRLLVFLAAATFVSNVKQIMLYYLSLSGGKCRVKSIFCSFFQVAIDTAAPLENDSAGGGYIDPMDLYGAYGSMRSFGRFCGGLDYNVSTKKMFSCHTTIIKHKCN